MLNVYIYFFFFSWDINIISENINLYYFIRIILKNVVSSDYTYIIVFECKCLQEIHKYFGLNYITSHNINTIKTLGNIFWKYVLK